MASQITGGHCLLHDQDCPAREDSWEPDDVYGFSPKCVVFSHLNSHRFEHNHVQAIQNHPDFEAISHFLDYLRVHKPRVAVFENVPAIRKGMVIPRPN